MPTLAQARILKFFVDNEDIYLNKRQYGATIQFSIEGRYDMRRKVRRQSAEALIESELMEEWQGKRNWEKGFRPSQAGVDLVEKLGQKYFEGDKSGVAKMTASEIYGIIKSYLNEGVRADFPPRYVCIPELAAGESGRRIDLFAMDCWKGNTRISYEIKVARSDFLKELKHPEKREFALSISNKFYFAAPEGLIAKSELPIEAGLVEVSDDGKVTVAVEAPFRETLPPTWELVAKIFRAIS
ncbi:MmcB family DNA repair protein [Candidatus Pacearchaeota archaeon]|nr:MmcB family DNA repair protein [Candidatus Pacearchaeota archaeon]